MYNIMGYISLINFICEINRICSIFGNEIPRSVLSQVYSKLIKNDDDLSSFKNAPFIRPWNQVDGNDYYVGPILKIIRFFKMMLSYDDSEISIIDLILEIEIESSRKKRWWNRDIFDSFFLLPEENIMISVSEDYIELAISSLVVSKDKDVLIDLLTNDEKKLKILLKHIKCSKYIIKIRKILYPEIYKINELPDELLNKIVDYLY